MMCSLASRPTLRDVMNPWRNQDKWTKEEFIKVMDYLGFKHKDFSYDDTGEAHKSWVYRNRRKIQVSDIWWGGNAYLIFYTDREIPIPDHPRKGEGKFKAIYLHDSFGICNVSVVEAEIVNVHARLEYLEGDKLQVSRTSPSRLLPYSPGMFDKLQSLNVEANQAYAFFEQQRSNTLDKEWKEAYQNDLKNEGSME